MNVYGMQKIKDFARSIGYVVEESGWQNKKMFTVRYPLAYDEYNTVIDYSYNSLDFVDLSNETAEELVKNTLDLTEEKYTTYRIKEIHPKFIKQFLIDKWSEYKKYLTEVKLNNIERDFN